MDALTLGIGIAWGYRVGYHAPMPWYYAEQGNPVGPVDDTELQRLAREGRLDPASLVWNPDFSAEWVPARTVPILAAQFSAPSTLVGAPAFPMPPYAHPTPIAQRPDTDTSGPDAPNGELTRRARESLSGAWGPAIGLIVIAYAIMFGAMLISSAIPLGNLVVQYVLMPPMIVGVIMYFMSRLRGEPGRIGQLFNGFSAFGPSVLAQLLLVLIILGVMLALIIPFIIAAMAILSSAGGWSAIRDSGPEAMRSFPSLIVLIILFYIALMVVATWIQLRFALVWAILADQPTYGALATLRRSVQIMRGRKWKFFCLMFRFFGWSLLAILTCGIGYLWVIPYMCAGYTAFYEDAAPRTPDA